MSGLIFVAAGIIVTAGILAFHGIRVRFLSVQLATILMVVASAVAGVVIELSANDSNIIGAAFTATLLAIPAGSFTFVFGRSLEQQRDKREK
jgi:hypothetical protein